MSRTLLTATCLFLLATATTLANDTLWTRRYAGAGGRDDAVVAVLVDAQDNVIVVGSTVGLGTGFDFSVVKYDRRGARLWVREISGAGASRDYAKAACLTPNGGVVVTGATGSFPDYDILTALVDSAGNEVWRRTHSGPGGAADEPAAAAAADDGSVVVAGYQTGSGGASEYVTIRYLPTGMPMWTSTYGGDGAARDVAVGPDGSVFVTGASSSIQNGLDYLTIKYTPTGDTAWTARYNGPGNADDAAVALAVADDGSVYVTGTSATAPPPGGTTHYATVKYNPDGSQGWLTRYTGTGGANSAVGLTLGSSAVYVTGSSGNAQGNTDYATIAYNTGTGSAAWTERFDGPPTKNDDPAGIAVGPDGKVHVIGTSVNWSNQGDYCPVRYATDGTREWVTRLDPGNDDQARSIAVDGEGYPVIAGNSFTGGNYDWFVVRFDTASGAVAEPGKAARPRAALKLAPNPARGWVVLEHDLPGPVVVSIVGADGRAVLRRECEAGNARLDLIGLAPGVYLARAEATGRAATGKLLVR
ncbi:T9SS type A sorting domain-containing protein [candidate division WOR-3 bacterium]|nr:T9SS type A sorting domain-containing protein [candidate division WOR-3 bacterium]